ncbi:MAG: hypothetical protein ACRDJH_27255 [Thermomicrobiales bacterium]
MARTLARLSVAASVAGVGLLMVASSTLGDVDIDSTLGMLLFWSLLFLPLPALQLLLTTWARRDDDNREGECLAQR